MGMRGAYAGELATRRICPAMPGSRWINVESRAASTLGLPSRLITCPATCGKSGSFTSDEEIDVLTPQPGLYAALVHGFQTDQVAGGPGA